MALPERAAEDRDPVGAGHTFVGGERPADHRVGPQQREHVRRCAHARHVERLAAAGKRVAQLPERSQRGHGLRLAFQSTNVSGATRSMLPSGFCSRTTTRRESPDRAAG